MSRSSAPFFREHFFRRLILCSDEYPTFAEVVKFEHIAFQPTVAGEQSSAIGTYPRSLDTRKNEYDTSVVQIAEGEADMQFIPAETDFTFDWVFYLLVAVFAITGLVIRSNPQVVRAVTKSFLGRRSRDESIEDIGLFRHNITAVLFGVGAVGVGLFVYFIVDVFARPDLDSAASFGIFIVACIVAAGIAFIKLFFYFVLSGLFNLKQEVREVILYYYGFLIITGMMLIPISVLIAFVPGVQKEFLIYLGAILAALLYILKNFKIFYRYTFSYRFSWLYILLYLCAFEILPVLIAGKWLKTFL